MSTNNPAALSWRDLGDPCTLLATGFGSGFAPVAPGTAGALVGAAIWWFAFADLDFLLRAAIAFGAFFASVVIVDVVVKRRDLGDEPAIVLDESVGVWFALLFAPKSWLWVCAGFVLFRIADIAKPWPVSRIDARVPGGLGIMADDVVAGLMAAAVASLALLGSSHLLT